MNTVFEREIKNRIERLKRWLQKNGVDLALVAQNADRFYFSGTLQDGVLLVSGEATALFIRRTLSRARTESPLDEVFGYGKLMEIGEYIEDKGLACSVIGLEQDVLPASIFLAVRSLFPDSKIVDISEAIRTMRAYKSEYEIKKIREAGRRLDRVFERMVESIRPGSTEYELYDIFTRYLREEGTCPYVRARRFNMEILPCFVLSGPNAAKHSAIFSPSAGGEGVTIAYPAGAGNRRIREGEPILIDAVFSWEGYHVDCTRIFALGRVAPEFRKAHLVSKRCHELFCREAGEGKSVDEICRSLKGIVKDEDLEEAFMGDVSFIGHGVGLELDELPIIYEGNKKALEEGMVVSLEPKFVFADGTAGYETTYCVRKGRCEAVNSFDPEIQVI